jgi:hypothetical protein
MPTKATRLTDAAIRSLKTGERSDGDGLAIRVGKDGKQKSWILRLSNDGNRTVRGLGSYPKVSLKQARAAAGAIRAGKEPTPEPEPAPVAQPLTFREVAHATIALWEPIWSGPRQAAQWRAMIDTYAGPIIGNKPIADVIPADITAVLEPIWLSKRETSQRLKQRLSTVFDYAIGHGLCNSNPVPYKVKALPNRPRQRQHFPALP